MAKPVARAAITSLWSPKMESACVASERAATWKTVAVSSPAILYMLGIISSRPCDAVNVVRQRPGLQRAVQRAGRAALALHLDHRRARCPRCSVFRSADHWSAHSPMGDDGVIG